MTRPDRPVRRPRLRDGAVRRRAARASWNAARAEVGERSSRRGSPGWSPASCRSGPRRPTATRGCASSCPAASAPTTSTSTALRRRGIVACNTPGYCTDEVADHALACVLAGWRGLWRLGAEVRAGGWDCNAIGLLRRIDESRLGIVGLGRIGRSLARKALALGDRGGRARPVGDGGRAGRRDGRARRAPAARRRRVAARAGTPGRAADPRRGASWR